MPTCKFCKRITGKKWYYCPTCGEPLRKRKILQRDLRAICKCGYNRARHKGLMDRLNACNDFRQSSLTNQKIA